MGVQNENERQCPFVDQLGAILECATLYCQKRDWKLEAMCLKGSRIRVTQPEYDNWDGGTYYWPFFLEVNHEEFAAIDGPEGRRAVEENLRTALYETVQGRFSPDHIGRVSVVPRLDVVASNPGRLQGINNQGNGHSKNPAAKEYDGLYFRSREEIFLYRALKASGALLAPGAVFVKATALRRRVELDFLVIKDGVVLVVEVDGGSHTERAVDAQERVLAFQQEGCHVFHVDAAECRDDAHAAKTAKRVLEHIKSLKFSGL